MPNPLDKTPGKLRDNPQWYGELQTWAGDRGNPEVPAPDPRKINRKEEEFLRLIMSMIGSRGYMDYTNTLRDQRAASGSEPPPVGTPTPRPFNPSDLDIGIDEVNKRKRKKRDPGGDADRIINQ